MLNMLGCYFVNFSWSCSNVFMEKAMSLILWRTQKILLEAKHLKSTKIKINMQLTYQPTANCCKAKCKKMFLYFLLFYLVQLYYQSISNCIIKRLFNQLNIHKWDIMNHTTIITPLLSNHSRNIFNKILLKHCNIKA